MTAFPIEITAESLRHELAEFWKDTLEVQAIPSGFALATPQSLPDGWQLIIELEVALSAGVKLTDRGRTLNWLFAQGVRPESETVQRHIDSICEQCEIQREGIEIFQWIPKGIEAVQLHLFGEALIQISHLHYLRELKPRSIDVPDRTLRRVFEDHHVNPVPGKVLDGRTRKRIKVDYFIDSTKPSAFQIIRQQGRILSTMERWGFRWNDLKSQYPDLRPAMIYDPHHQVIDSESQAIGEAICDLFCAYEDTDKIHDFLGSRQ